MILVYCISKIYVSQYGYHLLPYMTLFRSRARRRLRQAAPLGRTGTAVPARPPPGAGILSCPGTPASSRPAPAPRECAPRSEEHTSELQSSCILVCRILLENKYYIIVYSQF